MARLPRVYIENILYYVTTKSGHNQEIFIDYSDYREYLSLVARYKQQYGFKLFSYVLLPKHIHMLIELKNKIGISNIMHDINSLYTKIFNSRYHKKGHLFQARFKAILAEKEPYLLQLTRHIHLNPQRIGMVDNPKDYPYSSQAQFLNLGKEAYFDMRSEIEEVFEVLGAREDKYDDYVSNSDPREIEDFEKNLHKKKILGSKGFSNHINQVIEETIKQQKKPPAPKRTHLIYMRISGVAVLVLALTIAYFYIQNTSLRSRHDKTVGLYKRTLEMLEHERDKALSANKSIEDYVWKIKLTEKALAELQQKRKREAEALAMERELEGYSWKIKLTQIGGPEVKYPVLDSISIVGRYVISSNASKEGFPGSRYSKMRLRNGTIVWETRQVNKSGEIANWRGEWDGKVMKGILRRRSTDGVVRNFSFVSSGPKVRIKK